LPVSAYGGFTMCAGTESIGLIVPGSMRPSVVLWQRLYLRPLPHQHASLAAGRTAGGCAAAGLFTLTRLRAKQTAN
jgi:hypothetical protein